MTLKDTIINAVAGTIVLAAGGTLVGLKVNDARQDERIERIEALDVKMDNLTDHIVKLDGKLERLDGKIESDERHEPRQ